MKVYVAGLYLEARTSNAKRAIDSAQVKRLVLHFVRDVKRDQVTEAWNDGFDKNAGKSVAALKPRIRKLGAPAHRRTGAPAQETPRQQLFGEMAIE